MSDARVSAASLARLRDTVRVDNAAADRAKAEAH
jgi:hypothetical protein